MLVDFLRLKGEEDRTPNALREEVWNKIWNFLKPDKKDKPLKPNSSPQKPYVGPKAYKPQPAWTSAGCVVFDSLDDLSHIYVIQQKNWNTWSFPKGRVDAGESLKTTAVREVEEETGLQVRLLPGGYLGKGVGSMSVTHFFTAVRVGGTPGRNDHEVARVKLVTFTEAYKLFKRSGGAAGKRDMDMLRKAWEFTNEVRRERAGGEPELDIKDVPF